jgi:molybdopterin-biosynthesis enzyme MoeA-like protein
MNAMMDAVAPTLAKGVPMQSRTIQFLGGEGDIAKPLKDIQERYPDVTIGSYPFETPQGFATNLVLRSRDEGKLSAAVIEVAAAAQMLVVAGKARGWSNI